MNIRLTLFLLLAITQIAMPTSRILHKEYILHSGSVYSFATRPVDPYDIFRGRYVALSFEKVLVSVPKGVQCTEGQTVYGLIAEGEDGFAFFSEARMERPEKGDYLQTVADVCFMDQVLLKLPFSRYYLDEDLAPEAEKAYERASRTGSQKAYVTVRVANGKAVLEELYIEGQPVRVYLAGMVAKDGKVD